MAEEKKWFGGRGFESATTFYQIATRQREWSAQNQAREPRRAARLRRTTVQDREVNRILGIAVPCRWETRARKI